MMVFNPPRRCPRHVRIVPVKPGSHLCWACSEAEAEERKRAAVAMLFARFTRDANEAAFAKLVRV